MDEPSCKIIAAVPVVITTWRYIVDGDNKTMIYIYIYIYIYPSVLVTTVQRFNDIRINVILGYYITLHAARQ